MGRKWDFFKKMISSIFEDSGSTSSNNNDRINDNNSNKEDEEMFHGVPVRKLDEIAKSCFHGLGVRIYDGFLFYKYRSNRGHEKYELQMSCSKGQLKPLFPYSYPTVDEFLNKVHNSVKFID